MDETTRALSDFVLNEQAEQGSVAQGVVNEQADYSLDGAQKKLSLMERLEIERERVSRNLARQQVRLIVVNAAIEHLKSHPEAEVEWALFDAAL